MNNLAILQALIFEPGKAFAELDAKPRFWWPLLVLAISNAALTYWFMTFVDIEWLTDQTLRAGTFGANMTDEEITRMARDAAAQGSSRAVLYTLGTLLVMPVVMMISALYYLLAAKVTGVERGFRHWMTLACWASLPSALAVVPAALVMLSATSNQIGQESLQPLSLNELFFKRERGAPGYGLLSNINLFQFASLYLAAAGLKTWSRRTWLYGIIVSALPFVLIYGIWALFALR
jgi:hypothetical protein